MIKVYFDDGSKKKVNVDEFIEWVNKCNLVIDEKRNIYYDGTYIGYYVNLLDNNFGVLECILCLVLLALIILVLVKGGVILCGKILNFVY